jgi:hypothetical protein
VSDKLAPADATMDPAGLALARSVVELRFALMDVQRICHDCPGVSERSREAIAAACDVVTAGDLMAAMPARRGQMLH